MLCQLHIHDSKKLEEDEYIYFDTDDALHKYATVLEEHLLHFPCLLKAIERWVILENSYNYSKD